jgi:hypothetical protein
MPRPEPFPARRSLAPLLTVLLLAALLWRPVAAEGPGLRTVIVGGGPEPRHNQVAIERNVAYVARLLPAGAPRYLLFANGDAAAKTVLYRAAPPAPSPGERAFALLFGRREEAIAGSERYRAPELGRLDGAARRDGVASAFNWLRRGAPDPALLYFTGHGSPGPDRNLDNNVFDLWGEKLSVRDLAAHLAGLPAEIPLTLVMVQCHSGAFANLIFTRGDPKAPPVQRSLAGFFAATPDRPAAGCTPEVNEAEYHDFTSYFFAALSGRDRVGRKVTGADYNHDNRVGMDEAYAYSLLHDASIDVPVCTSDAFLRAAMPADDVELFQTDFSAARGWATPAQAAALDGLSRALGFAGEGRLGEAYAAMRAGLERRRPGPGRNPRRRFARARDEARRLVLDRWPRLGTRDAPGFAAARAEAVVELSRSANEPALLELFAADEALAQADDEALAAEVRQAQVLRFVRLAKSVILARQLRESGPPSLRDRFERLVRDEARSLPPLAAAGSR